MESVLGRHVHQLPDVSVEVLETPAVHGAFFLDRFPGLAACCDGFGDGLVHLPLAVGRKAGEDLGLLRGVADAAVEEVAEPLAASSMT